MTARNLITDVTGLRVGNAQDARARTGLTVVLPDARAVCAVDVRGGAPGTRETDALNPSCLVDAVDAVVLSGGSVYGLAAADGAAAWLGARGRGYVLAGSALVAPVVPAAILFDLTNGGDKAWGETPPYRALARAACEAARADFALGNAGAGFGARTGRLKGGLGSAAAGSGGFTVGALMAVNAFGSAVMPGSDTLWAWAFERDGELGGQTPPGAAVPAGFPPDTKLGSGPGQNTTIGVVATDAALTQAECKRLAIMAQDGLARAIRPIHTPFDGDVVFALSTGAKPLPEPRALHLTLLGSIAADTAARAAARGVFEAGSLGDAPGYRTAHPSGFAQRR